MKQFIYSPALIILMSFFRVNAQEASVQIPLPAATVIPHYLLSIGYNTTTVLVFSAPVRPVDRGDRDVLAQKQAGVDNVLKLKAARKNFPTTNLHVFTGDGRIYAFDITYSDGLSSTHDLTELGQANVPVGSRPIVLLTQHPVNSDDMARYVRELRDLPKSRKGPASHSNRMTFRLERIGIAGPLLLFRFQIANRSNLDYNLDFIRLYIRDREKTKRTSVQEREILPIYEDSSTSISGDSAITHVLAVPAFTLADGKQFIIEAYEKNGGRSLTLYIKNKTLFRAKKL